MAWRLAKALEGLRSHVNELAPNRSKASDGTIGDAAHASRSSDHNPWVKDGATGVVTGMDITNDPVHGISSQALADALLTSRDERIKYVISNARIASGTGQGQPAWVWRKYTGKNPHDHHVHISVKPEKAHYDSSAPWAISLDVSPEHAATPVVPELPVLRKGARGADVERLQRLLNKSGAVLTVDGDFGAKTLAAVKAFQRGKGLVPDGIIGAYSWRALSA